MDDGGTLNSLRPIPSRRTCGWPLQALPYLLRLDTTAGSIDVADSALARHSACLLFEQRLISIRRYTPIYNPDAGDLH